jgi:putative Holliday junction resolvase
MRAAGIDFGKVRVGLAISDELGMMAHPRPFLDGQSMKGLLSSLQQLRDAEQIDVFVVGLPRMLDGTEGPAARRVRRFVELLGRVTQVDVELIDEWLSTREAQSRLHEAGHNTKQSRSKVDSAAAALLLQAWLDRRQGTREERDTGDTEEGQEP